MGNRAFIPKVLQVANVERGKSDNYQANIWWAKNRIRRRKEKNNILKIIMNENEWFVRYYLF